MRLAYPSSIKIVRVPCTGKVDVIHILHAFEKGADGVYAVGCLEGECHFNQGNFRARKRIGQAQTILEELGIGGQRAQMYNLSSSEGPRFAEYAIEMDQRIRDLGPNPIRRMLKSQHSQKGLNP